MDLTIDDLWISVGRPPGTDLIRGLSLKLEEGTTLGLLGPSGSGKTVTALSILGLPPGGRDSIRRGSIRLGELELTRLPEAEYQRIRGAEIAMVFQDPGAALTPVHPIGRMLAETIRAHSTVPPDEVDERVLELLAEVGFQEPEAAGRNFAYELSGGMRQRAMIALALAAEPSILIADEPTSALDAIARDEILTLIESVRERRGISVLLISHDPYVTGRMADRVMELDDGRRRPARVASRQPDVVIPPPPVPFDIGQSRGIEPVLELRGVSATYSKTKGPRPGTGAGRDTSGFAIADISFELTPGETLGLVGPSGCGKTTVARCALRLLDPASGEIRLAGRDISTLSQRRLRPLRHQMSAVFQDPGLSLNPRHTAERILAAPLAARGIRGHAARRRRLLAAIKSVELDPDLLGRRPREMSGGQQQRLALARALVTEPRVLICDEPFTALDIPLRDQLTRLLGELQLQHRLACLFIAHDLEVIGRIADRVAVMLDGRIIETGETAAVLADPSSQFTRTLVATGPLGRDPAFTKP